MHFLKNLLALQIASAFIILAGANSPQVFTTTSSPLPNDLEANILEYVKALLNKKEMDLVDGKMKQLKKYSIKHRITNFDVDFNTPGEIQVDTVIKPLNRLTWESDEVPSVQLFTRTQPDLPFTINLTNIDESPLNINDPTKIIVHGWNGSGEDFWIERMKDKLLINANHNVIVFNWKKLAKIDYLTSLNNTQKAGEYLGEVVTNLLQSGKLRPKGIQIIGHGLGAHVAGIAGAYIKKVFGEKVARITGLDPTRPLIEVPVLIEEGLRLDKEDADFVDIIHTNAAGLGYAKSYGHADFYPNGGVFQPGCEAGELMGAFCNHRRSYELYTESINSRRFLSTWCEKMIDLLEYPCRKVTNLSMGHYLQVDKAHGVYYVVTNAKAPFAKW